MKENGPIANIFELGYYLEPDEDLDDPSPALSRVIERIWNGEILNGFQKVPEKIICTGPNTLKVIIPWGKSDHGRTKKMVTLNLNGQGEIEYDTKMLILH
jgi:hypothetical protein